MKVAKYESLHEMTDDEKLMIKKVVYKLLTRSPLTTAAVPDKELARRSAIMKTILLLFDRYMH